MRKNAKLQVVDPVADLALRSPEALAVARRDIAEKKKKSLGKTGHFVKGVFVPAGFYTRQMVAEKLEISVSEVRRRERMGILKPSGKNEHGWQLFSEADVENASMTRAENARARVGDYFLPHFTAEEASTVYTLLDEGKRLVDIVKSTCLHPTVIEDIFESYKRLNGGLFITPDTLGKMNQLPLEGNFPIETEGQLLTIMMTAAEDCVCTECKKKPRTLCKGCGVSMGRRAAEEDKV